MTNPGQNLPPVDRGFWYDGQWRSGQELSLSITDPGLLYGATVFSTLRIYDDLQHPATAWIAHRDRLGQTVAAFEWQMPDWDRVEVGAATVASHYPVVRVTLFPDGREWITGRSLPVDLAQRQRHGITAWVMDPSVGARSLPNHKTGNYLTPWLGLQQAQQRQAQETILVNQAGEWLETCTGNLWGWCDGQWYTPPLAAGILPGIARSRLIRGLRCHNREVLESPWDQHLIRRLTMVAYSNCVVEVVPLRMILRNAEMLEYQIDADVLQELFRAFVSGHSQMR